MYLPFLKQQKKLLPENARTYSPQMIRVLLFLGLSSLLGNHSILFYLICPQQSSTICQQF